MSACQGAEIKKTATIVAVLSSKMVVGDGFEPSKSVTADLQSVFLRSKIDFLSEKYP